MQPNPVQDLKIQREVESEMQCAPDVEAAHIGVSVRNHAVTLSGTVNDYAERMAARAAAQRIHAVTAVADELCIHYAGDRATEAELAESVAYTLENSTVVALGSVKAGIRFHTVTLTGTVAREFQRDAAVAAVGAIPGVSYIDNRIALVDSPTRVVTAATDTSAHLSAAPRVGLCALARHGLSSVGSKP